MKEAGSAKPRIARHIGRRYRSLNDTVRITPTHCRARLQRCLAGSGWNHADGGDIVFSDKSHFQLCPDNHRICVWRRLVQCADPAFTTTRHTSLQSEVMVWGAISFDSRVPLGVIRSTLTAQQYVDDILRTVLLPLLFQYSETALQRNYSIMCFRRGGRRSGAEKKSDENSGRVGTHNLWFTRETPIKGDPDFVINLLNLSVEDRQAKAERQLQKTNSQLELEKIKLQQIEREIQLQKALAEGQATQQSSKGDTNNLENLIKSVKTLTIQIPTKTKISVFFSNPNVPENLKAEILINILGERAHNILLYIKDDEIKEYDLVKSLILRQFQPTAQECLLNFRKAKRQADETHVQFATRLRAMFKY
ncbi:transposable element Tc1 transposase [Trichonephila clavipes]|nr:transposable element Tc1 transposase [Trichonephila clavipes]